MEELICIVCPRGCHLKVDVKSGYIVTGNLCSRGIPYAKNELSDPRRILTTTIKVKNAVYPRCPVKTENPIPKNLLLRAMKEIDQFECSAPIHEGQIVLENICETKINVICTRDMKAAAQNE